MLRFRNLLIRLYAKLYSLTIFSWNLTKISFISICIRLTPRKGGVGTFGIILSLLCTYITYYYIITYIKYYLLI